MFSRLPSFILIALLVLVGIQLFFFGFILQIIKDIKSTVNIENSNFTSSIEDKTESNNTPKSLDQIKNVAQEKKEEL